MDDILDGSRPLPTALTPADDAQDCGLVLAEARRMKGLSVPGLAALVGVREQDILDLEAGRVIPPQPAFGRCMRALGYTV